MRGKTPRRTGSSLRLLRRHNDLRRRNGGGLRTGSSLRLLGRCDVSSATKGVANGVRCLGRTIGRRQGRLADQGLGEPLLGGLPPGVELATAIAQLLEAAIAGRDAAVLLAAIGNAAGSLDRPGRRALMDLRDLVDALVGIAAMVDPHVDPSALEGPIGVGRPCLAEPHELGLLVEDVADLRCEAFGEDRSMARSGVPVGIPDPAWLRILIMDREVRRHAMLIDELGLDEAADQVDLLIAGQAVRDRGLERAPDPRVRSLLPGFSRIPEGGPLARPGGCVGMGQDLGMGDPVSAAIVVDVAGALAAERCRGDVGGRGNDVAAVSPRERLRGEVEQAGGHRHAGIVPLRFSPLPYGGGENYAGPLALRQAGVPGGGSPQRTMLAQPTCKCAPRLARGLISPGPHAREGPKIFPARRLRTGRPLGTLRGMSTDTAKKQRKRKSPEQRLEALIEKLAKAKADVRKNDRQADARRKILVGGSLLALAKQGDAEAQRILGKVPKMLASKDRDMLEPILAEHRADQSPQPSSDDIVHLLAIMTVRLFGDKENGLGLASLLEFKNLVRTQTEIEQLTAYFREQGLRLEAA